LNLDPSTLLRTALSERSESNGRSRTIDFCILSEKLIGAETLCFGIHQIFPTRENLVALKRALNAPTRGVASGVHTKNLLVGKQIMVAPHFNSPLFTSRELIPPSATKFS